MGWFETPNAPGAVIGDDPLDETAAFWRRLADLYQEGLGRKPTLEELRLLLQTSLSVAPDEFFDGLDEKRITGVSIKTAKAPKRRKYALGDVFAIPLGDGRYAFGHVIYVDKNKWMFVEIYSQTSQSKRSTQEILNSPRLYKAVWINDLDSERNRLFEVVGSAPPPGGDELAPIEVAFGSGVGDLWKRPLLGGPKTHISTEEYLRLREEGLVLALNASVSVVAMTKRRLGLA